MAIKTGVGSPIKVGDYGYITVSDDKSAPFVYCYGGIDVGSKKSGEYMYDYFNKTGKTYNLYVADSAKVAGNKSYDAVNKKIQELGLTPKFKILYAFSGGHSPTRGILTTHGAAPFDKIYIVDIWMEASGTAKFWTEFVEKNKAKIEYYHTKGGAVNPAARDSLAKNASKAVLNKKGHMNTNVDAVDALLAAFAPPFSSTDVTKPSPDTGTGASASIASTGTQSGTQSNVVNQDDSKKTVNGKLMMKKKSGPGELTGVTELELIPTQYPKFFRVEFKDLQFTEAGDYVVTVSSDSPDVGSLDINVKVNRPEDPVPQDKPETPPEKEPAGNRPIIAQIDPPTIKIRPIDFQQDISGPKSQQPVTAGFGWLPTVYYNGYQIRQEDIEILNLYHDGMVPKMDITFKDSLNLMKGNGSPTDGTYLDLFIDSTSRDIKYIHLVFKINNFDKGQEKPSQTFSFNCTLNIPELFIPQNKSYSGTSFEVIRQICKELGLGFNSNINETKDDMKWRNSNKPTIDFIDDIIKHSYINDESYMLGYIDYYYCFNYVDINKEFKRDNKSDKLLDTTGNTKLGSDTKNKQMIPAILSTDNSNTSSTTYVMKYETENNSSEVSEEKGYRTVTRFYDRVKKQFLEFTVDSQTSDGKKTMILKGPENDTKLFDKNIVTRFLGKIDFLNTHQNYNYAKVQNDINLDNLKKIAVNCTLPNANFCLYKYMKIHLGIINKGPTATEELQNYRYSGDYILWSISFNFEKGKLSQELKLVRSELGKTPDEQKSTKPEPKKEPKQQNENPPIAATPSVVLPPNARYNVGDVFRVQNPDGIFFQLTVKEVLSNGTEILGNLTEIDPNGTSAVSATPLVTGSASVANNTTTTGSQSQAPGQNNQNQRTGTASTPENGSLYIVSVLNPVGEKDTNLYGEITVHTQFGTRNNVKGIFLSAIGTVYGTKPGGPTVVHFTEPIGPIKNGPFFESDPIGVIQSVTTELESLIVEKHNVKVKLQAKKSS